MEDRNAQESYLLVNVPLLRPAWPVPTFSRVLPLLREHGFAGDWWDENIQFFRYFYSETKLKEAHRVIQERHERTSDLRQKEVYRDILDTPIEEMIKALSQVSHKETFRELTRFQDTYQKVFIDCARLLSYAHDVIFDYNQLIFRSPVTGQGYNFAQTADVIELVQGAKQNISLDFFSASTLPRIQEMAPSLVGISVSSGFELVPAFTLARLVKESLGDRVHVSMGGNFFSRVERRFRSQEPAGDTYLPFWSWMDSYVYSKGDFALLKLVEGVFNHQDLAAVPNLVYRRDDEIKENGFSYGPGIDDLPRSEFGSVLANKHLYFVPPEYLSVPVYTSVGCSYAKCSFCAIDKMSGNFHGGLEVRKVEGAKVLQGPGGESHRFYRRPEKILAELESLQAEHGVSHFSFNDETFDIDFALQLAELVIARDAKIYWQAFARAEQQLTSPEVCAKLHQGGCRLLRIGFEYLSQDKLNQTHKGYFLKKQKQIAEALNQAGIWIHAYFMIGTEEDYANAIGFFQDHPEFYELFHTLEFFSQVNDRHSLEVITGLQKGELDEASLDREYPQFRIWYDVYPRARELVKDIRRFARERFPVYHHLYEPCEVAYFPVLNCLHGLASVKRTAQAAMGRQAARSGGRHESAR
jgi:hypothetical protein